MMAQKTVVELTDDLDEGPAIETVHFGLDGFAYEIDLNAANAQRLRDALKEYVENGRRVRKDGSAAKPRRVQVSTGSADREQNAAIRHWAQANGHEVSDRGRLPRGVVELFKEAHAGTAEPDAVSHEPVFASV